MTLASGIDFGEIRQRVQRLPLLPRFGYVVEVTGLVIASRGPVTALGDFCEIMQSSGRVVRTQVVGFRNGLVLSMPLEEIDGIQIEDRVVARDDEGLVGVGPELLGRVVDGFGQPLDRGQAIVPSTRYSLYPPAGSPLDREHITDHVVTGIRALDAFTLCGKGQRLGIFGGSGVGKSTLLGAIARDNSADVTVVAMIGERNREVRAFIEQELGPEGARRSVVVCATSDQPAPLRVRACFVALAISEYFRDQGRNVLLIMDSVTRLAMAQREIGLASGEPPSQKGYTPSVFNLLPKVLERAGSFQRGSITGIFTVLVEGDDFNEPICDAVRAILDGHLILSRRLASLGHYPAIDLTHSVSRLFRQLASPQQLADATRVREAIAMLEDSRDLIDLGAYVPGRNPRLDAALRVQPELNAFLRQGHEKADFRETTAILSALAARLA